ncbi:dihydrofolate reductase-like [Sinocyclocheilus rhinocerous]|uniref:dihydrofolate reductase-like n=1 Tax=Sinocyclocheilus rhinocerous TaxID=307959 RepID=UPI0007B7A80C|nr:PREDICTED: dihydrofolate reductase-like [Sinocyclocheilus rhinocerous]
MMNIEGEEMRKPIRLIAAACKKNFSSLWIQLQLCLHLVSVWGRICWFSCSETVFPLANCINLVLSRKLTAVPPLAHYLCKDFGSVIHLASEPPLCHIVETIWVLGGPEVYKESLEHPCCDLIYLTDIMADFDCDVFFPKFDRNVFRKQKGFPGVPDEIHEENGIKFQFQVFKKEA